VKRVEPDRDPALAELRGRVEGDFRALAATKAALRSKVHGVANLKSQARQRPLWVLGLAAATGLVGAYVVRKGRKKIAGRLLALLAGAAVRRLGRSFGSGAAGRRSLRG
jgi:hypothetical protein